MVLNGLRAAVSMKADGFQVPAGVKKALAPAIAAASIAAPAFAEGTGEAIGIDDGRLVPCSRATIRVYTCPVAATRTSAAAGSLNHT